MTAKNNVVINYKVNNFLSSYLFLIFLSICILIYIFLSICTSIIRSIIIFFLSLSFFLFVFILAIIYLDFSFYFFYSISSLSFYHLSFSFCTFSISLTHFITAIDKICVCLPFIHIISNGHAEFQVNLGSGSFLFLRRISG